MRTERDEGDKAERKSWAHHRRSDESRRRRSCLSGRCRGRRPWSGGPRRERERGEGLVHRVSCLQIPIPTIYLRFIFKTSHILLAISSVSVIHINCFRWVKQNSKHGTRSFCFSVWKCVCCMCKWTKRNDNHTRKDPNMAMEERKCQMSWSSKNESRIQSLLCSRDSAGVFWVPREKHTRSTNATLCRE